mgnify:CR=1 FL=1
MTWSQHLPQVAPLHRGVADLGATTPRELLRRMLSDLDDGLCPAASSKSAPELCEQARKLLENPMAAEPEFEAMRKRLDDYFGPRVIAYAAGMAHMSKNSRVGPLQVTLKEFDSLLAGRRSVKTLRTDKRLPPAIGKRGREHLYVYCELVKESRWEDDLPTELEARRILQERPSESLTY